MKSLARKLFILVGLVLSSQVGASDSSALVLARLSSGEAITEKDLSGYLARRVDLRSVSRNAWGVEGVVRDMAMTRVLLLEEGRQVAQEDELSRFDDKVALSVHKKLSPACNPPADEAAARMFYDQNPDAFRVPPFVRLNRVMLATKDEVAGVPAVGWLLEQAQAIASGKRKFDEVAQKAAEIHKLDPQGDIGWVTLTDDLPLLRALADAKAGELVGPVTEGDFAYLFHVVAKRESRNLTWDEAAASASGRAVRYCREQSVLKLREQLFKKYGVEIDRAAIRSLFARGPAGK